MESRESPYSTLLIPKPLKESGRKGERGWDMDHMGSLRISGTSFSCGDLSDCGLSLVAISLMIYGLAPPRIVREKWDL